LKLILGGFGDALYPHIATLTMIVTTPASNGAHAYLRLPGFVIQEAGSTEQSDLSDDFNKVNFWSFYMSFDYLKNVAPPVWFLPGSFEIS
jgi:hypothetical protein